MANKEKIDYLLLDIRELETLVAGMRDAEFYPVSFFGQTFNLTHKILNELHALETTQVELLRKQMEEHQALIQTIPHSIPQQIEKPVAQPVITPPVRETVREVTIEQTEPEVVIEEHAPIIQPIPEMRPEPVISKPEPEIKSVPTPLPQPEPIPQTQPVQTERAGVFLSDILEKKNLSDFRKAFSLNDRFRFRRELFGGNEEQMNKALTDLNDLHTYEDSVTYLNNVLNWNIEDEAVTDFIKLLEKRFL